MQQELNSFNNINNEMRIVELIPSNINNDINSLFTNFHGSSNKETTNSYYKGDQRSEQSKKFKDYIYVYNYLISSLHNQELKDQLNKIYEPVFNNIYNGEDLNENDSIDIQYKLIRDLFLIVGEHTTYDKCKGYLIIINKDDKNNYGYIYIFNEKNSLITIYPFINCYYKYIGKKSTISIKREIFNNKDNLNEIIEKTNEKIIDFRNDYKFIFNNNYNNDLTKFYSLY